MTRVIEIFGMATAAPDVNWAGLVREQRCPYLRRKCIKIRKSEPDVSIGTCTVAYASENLPVVVCPYRLLERKQVFTDCLHLLTTHEPGNELHVVSEVSIPGGSVDYFLVSTRDRRVRDFVGIELQALDTTGTVWPERERFLKDVGLPVDERAAESDKGFGINWKMTAKTTLVQLHHKIQTFEHVNKHLVLALQDYLLDYMQREFQFSHLSPARIGDPMHMHSYKLVKQADLSSRLELDSRLSTDTQGVAHCLGLQAEAKVELEEIVQILEAKISDETLFTV